MLVDPIDPLLMDICDNPFLRSGVEVGRVEEAYNTLCKVTLSIQVDDQ